MVGRFAPGLRWLRAPQGPGRIPSGSVLPPDDPLRFPMPKDSAPQTSQADKDRSKQMNRAVTAKTASRPAVQGTRSAPARPNTRAAQQRASTAGRGPARGGNGGRGGGGG